MVLGGVRIFIAILGTISHAIHEKMSENNDSSCAVGKDPLYTGSEENFNVS